MLDLVAACAAWHGLVTGYYAGDVRSTNAEWAETWIEDTPAGLGGRYVIHEKDGDVPGTLTPVRDEGCDTALFRWTDRYGTGLMRLRFRPVQHCFEGAWGRETINPVLTYTTCFKAPVTS